MMKRPATLCLIVLLATHVALLSWGAYTHSPTIDEIAYLPAGVSHLQLGNFQLANVSPPLIPCIAAAPLLALGVETNWAGLTPTSEAFQAHTVGSDFIQTNGPRSLHLFRVARWALIPLSLLGAVSCYLWARELAGQQAGLMSAYLWCYCPNVLAHAQLVTVDAGATALGVTATYAFWRWLKSPKWTSALIAGIALGCAESAKTTLVVLMALWPTVWLACTWMAPRTRFSGSYKRECAQLAAILGVTWYVLISCYAFQGCFKRLDEYRFVSKSFAGNAVQPGTRDNRFARSWLGVLPVPLPEQYVIGIDLQKRDLENVDPTYNNGLFESYLRGRWSSQGWWYFYLYCVALKVPLGTLLLLVLAMRLRISRAGGGHFNWRDDVMLLAPLITILVLVSSQTGFTIHFRYVLPMFPFAFVWLSQVICAARPLERMAQMVVIIALSWSLSSSLWATPHHLSFFNELTGGPLGGHFHLLDSNIDWGQDLLYLKDWITAHPEARPMHVGYLGLFPPQVIGMNFPRPPKARPKLDGDTMFPSTLQSGWYAISVGYLRGDRFDGEQHLEYFLRMKPVGFAGYSIYIFHVP
jgi:hypothetical protein